MATLSNLFGGGDSGGAVAAYDPLPIFGVWSNYGNNPRYSTWSAPGVMVGSGIARTDGEIYNSYTGWNYTNSTYSSNSTGSYAVASTSYGMAEGHFLLNLPSAGGYYPSVGKVPNTVAASWRYFGSIINPKGIRQRNSLHVSSTTIQLRLRGAHTWFESVSWSTYSNTSGTPGNNTQGMASYNSRTDTLAIVTNGGSTTYRVHVWKNPNVKLDGPDSTGSLITFLSQAYNAQSGASYYYNDFSWSTNNATSYNESLYHMRVVLGDNDIVGLSRMTPNSEFIYGWLQLNSTSGATVSVNTGVSQGLTTTYGIDSGNYYGARFNITWNNDWAVTYCPYYYYGSGAMMFYIYTPDPSKYYYIGYSSSSSGVGIAPMGEGQFVLGFHEYNADSSSGGMYYAVVDPGNAFSSGNYSNGSSIYYSTVGGLMDTGYTSTNYPVLLPLSSWAGGPVKS